MRRSTSSLPINSSTASIEGVCAVPVSITRNGIASFAIFSECAVMISLIAALNAGRFQSTEASLSRSAFITGRMSAV